MPTINVSLKDLSSLTGKKISQNNFRDLLEYAKAEFSGSDGDEVSVQFNDTNLPYLWCAEGLALLFRGVLGKKRGIPDVKICSSDYKVIVDKSVRPVRPFISAFVAKGGRINDFLLKQLIQLQEKFCEHFGKHREKVAIGVYPSKKIKFPVSYSAVPPKSVRFVPLDFSKEMTLAEILDEHPKGKEFAWILQNTKKYPLLSDYNKEVLSFPPVINSRNMGKLGINDNELFFEATGTDSDSVNLAACIFAHVLSIRGFKVYSVKISHVGKSLVSPDFSGKKHKLDRTLIKRVLGLDLKEAEIKRLLEKARFNYKGGIVHVPCFRNDIMHSVDIIEDIGIMYGFDRIDSLDLSSYTAGETSGLQDFVDKSRDLVLGLGFQEVLSPILSSREALVDRMNFKKSLNLVEVTNPSSVNFSVLRSWLLPGLMDVLMHNKHVDFPQRAFEQGLIAVREGDAVRDEEHIAGLLSYADVSFTDVKQAVEALLRNLGFEASYEDMEHNSFIEGRVARVVVQGKNIGFVGEMHPFVLNAWGLDMPVAGFELDLSGLFAKK